MSEEIPGGYTPASYTRELLEAIVDGPYPDSNLRSLIETWQLQARIAIRVTDEGMEKHLEEHADELVDLPRAEALAIEVAALRHERGMLKAEARHWKGNHANMVAFNRQLRERPDLGNRAASVVALREALEFIQKKPGECREIFRKHGFVFDDMEERWQKLAFTLYTDIVEAAERATAALNLGVE